ncbi:MAG: ribosomal protein S18-alanine N-acetyltransferase [Lachnospiraceae bacterium]|nr:ribosomal protein S18-alanine N-acetyltransferase [bacterium]MDY5516816.1 ribosomal protein S18-alanine N-acetyltransferase [Lachnospiraceae bacterium]
MTIRKMTAEDVEAVAGLEAQIFSMPWSVQGFADTLCREDVLFLVAREAGELLGYVGVYCAADEGEITNVAVAQAARRQGVGGALLDALIEALAAREIFRIVLEVRVSNEPAIGLYGQMGFQIVGTRKNFYEKPTEDAYVMVREPEVPTCGDGMLSLQ